MVAQEIEIKPSIRILVPVWGHRYIDMFLDIGLPSMLTRRNLPTLAAAYPCEFVFLTKAADKNHISWHPTFQALSKICPVTFTAIDDLLIPGMEGYCLTLAFARGIHEVGAKMVDTYFLFMNADFVISDGAYETLLRHIRDGRRAIVAPSLRSISENTCPILESKRDDDQTLTISAREMVGLTLKHLHPTAAANIVDGNIAYNSATNQFFWWVDNQTLIARFYLLFMFCIRPERELRDIPGFCDYTFVAEMCPSGDLVILDDSDDCYIMELQGREQELHYLRFGQPTFDAIARHLSEWTTRNHRLYSRRSIVFHAGDRPASLDSVERNAAGFMEEIFKRMDGEPKATRNHPYWIGSVQAAASLRSKSSYDAAELDEEVGGSALDRMAKSAVAARSMFVAMAGKPPMVNMLHYDWIDYRAVIPYLRAALADRSARILYVNGGLINFEPLMRKTGARCQRVDMEDLLTRPGTQPGVAPADPYNFCFIYIGSRHIGNFGAALARITEMTTKDARLICLIRDDSPDHSSAPLSRVLLRQLAQIRPFELSVKNVVVSGGAIKNIVRDAILKHATRLYRYGVFRSPGAVIALSVLMPYAAIINLVAKLRNHTDMESKHCSSLLMHIEKHQA